MASQSDFSNTSEDLLRVLYQELRRVAQIKLASEKPGQTLQPTALVHEAYLRLAKEDRTAPWRDRQQFFAAAAEAMRRILVETARRKASQKRGGEKQRDPIEPNLIESRRPAEEILALHDALHHLAEKFPEKAELVKLRYFVGMTTKEAAEALNISASSADRQWSYARAWLHQQITECDSRDNEY